MFTARERQLLGLLSKKEQSVSELTGNMGNHIASTSTMLRHLHRMKCVVKRQDDVDMRVFFYSLTPLGQKHVELIQMFD